MGVLLVLGFAGFAAAGAQKDKDKFDPKKLLGKWEPADGKESIILEFTDKGKMSITFEGGGKTEKVEGTYKLDGDKLEMVMVLEGKDKKEERKETVTITKLTDDEWSGKDAKGKEESFKRPKKK
jgi:uncharacterized protein (TIGR03066 family)